MQLVLKTLLAVLALFAAVSLPSAGAAASEKRLALVIGNASYKAKALATPVNDAALIAQTLQAAGFDVMGARDLGGDLLRQTFGDFVDRVAKAGPDVVAAVYFAGYGLQLEGENYLIPIDANIAEVSDVPVRALRLSEQLHALAALHLKATFIILDAARASPFVLSGQPPASGFAWVEPESNMLIAFNATPGTVAPDVGNGYGPYAKALAEMIREGSLTPANVFDRVRLRVNELTKGAQVPWDASNVAQFNFLERGPGAPPRADFPEHTASMRSQPMRSLGAEDAYMVALMRDTFDAYADFLADYWHDPMTKRVRALLALRREAITWRRTCQANASDAYWSYLERYPRGPHLADARRLLTHLGAAIEPPFKFARVDYDVPPPLPDELEYLDRPVFVFDDPALAFEQPQPSPVYFLAPSPSEFLDLRAPAAPAGAHILPSPIFMPLPVYLRLPADVLPPNPSISSDAHQTPAVRTAIDILTRPNEQVAPASISSARTANPLAVNPVAPEETKAPPSPPLPTISAVPQWLTDITALSSRGSERPAVATDIAPTTMLAPPLAAVPPQTRRNAKQPATGNVPLPVARSVALARPQTGLLPRTSRAAVPSSQTTGSIPSSVASAPRPTRNRSKPNANVASTSSPDQAKPPKPHPLNKPAPSRNPVRAPQVSPVASSPAP